MMRMMTGGFIALLFLACCLPVVAEDWSHVGFNDRLQVGLAGFWPQLSTDIRLDANEYDLGTTISLEDDLGLSDRDATPALLVDWRVKGGHHLELGWMKLDRSGQRRLSAEIEFGDEVFPVNEVVNSGMDTRILYLNYRYDFFHEKERSSFGVAGGFHIDKISAFIHAENINQEESTDVTAPLPLIGLFGGYAFAPKWGFWGRGQFFALEFDDYDGSLYNIWLEVYHNPFEHFGWGFGYNLFDFDLDATKKDFTGKLDFTYQGPMVFVKFRLP